MTPEAWLTLAVLLGIIGLLATERIQPSFVMMAGMTALLVAGVVDASQALSGFSNPAPMIVAALFVLAAGAEATGALDRLIDLALGRGTNSNRLVLARMLIPSATASAFLNNTPIVAMVAPRISAWARRHGVSPSRYLIPISYASVLGGVTTLMGTSTNVVVSGLLIESGQDQLGFFELTRAGLPVAAAGIAMLVLLGPRLLPDRKDVGADLRDPREFTVEMMVTDSSPLAGRTVSEAGLRNLEAVYLVEIERNGRVLAPVEPTEVLQPSDRLTFAGNVGRIIDLQRIPGLAMAQERHFAASAATGPLFYEAVVSPGSTLAGRTLKEIGFRGRYGAAVVAIHRAHERVGGKLGEVLLRAGDVLLALGPSAFGERLAGSRDFLLVAPLTGNVPVRRRRAWLVGAVGLALVTSVTTGALDFLQAALLASGAIVLLRVLTPAEALRSVDLNVVLLIASSFGVGQAMAQSGLASTLANGVTTGLETFGPLGILAGVLLATMLLTELISNTAAAVLMFPIAMAVAAQAAINPRTLAIAVAIGASMSFLGPIGYQTNMMVYSMGGYRFTDFTRIGAPVTLAVFATALATIPVFWPLS
jgi:di/tricarboxylate transporter